VVNGQVMKEPAALASPGSEHKPSRLPAPKELRELTEIS
jgi:hypothetical protein